jgi:hypothetical protein
MVASTGVGRGAREGFSTQIKDGEKKEVKGKRESSNDRWKRVAWRCFS